MREIADTTGASQRHARFILNTRPTTKPALAQHLDRQADAELFMGHVLAAERLAHRAAELRETGQ